MVTIFTLQLVVPVSIVTAILR